MDDSYDMMVDRGTIKGQENQWIKVRKKGEKFPSFKEWLKKVKGVEDPIGFGSSSEGIRILNQWNAEYEDLNRIEEKLKRVM